jgi:PBP1b-binding outer membrane lipoprotein LpoB
MKRIAAIAAFALLAAGCGSRQPLQPAPGQALPPKSAMASVPPTTEQLLEIPPLAKPERVDEPLKRSQEREEDRFDLPPPE